MTATTPLLWVNGRRVDANAPHISALDRGYMRADGLFETMRAYDGVPACLRRHIDRLCRGAAVLGIPVPEYAGKGVAEAGRAALDAGWRDAVVRLSVSRGIGDVTMVPLPDQAATVVVTASPLAGRTGGLYEAGIALHVAAGTRNEHSVTTGLKTLGYADAVIAFNAARSAGFDEALFLDTEGHVSEATTANIFAVRQGHVSTPPLSCGILAGITRALVLELAGEHGIPLTEEILMLKDLEEADEVFITSSVRELMPVARIGAQVVGDGSPGPTYRQLHQLFAPVIRRCE